MPFPKKEAIKPLAALEFSIFQFENQFQRANTDISMAPTKNLQILFFSFKYKTEQILALTY